MEEIIYMENQFTKKYGLLTAISMVVGIVIGSGVFFKAEVVLSATGGNLPLGILAWGIGAAIMIICAYTFSVMATRYERVNGAVDYAEATVGSKYSYFLGWFLATIYTPALTAILAWVSARYTCVLFGYSIFGSECLAISALFLVISYALNALSPILAGKFQVSSTVIKLVPLLLMAVVGTITGLSNGMTIENFTTVVHPISTGTALFTAVVSTSFAYEGWIIATSINAELRDAKKNLPRALVLGTLIIALVYILYYIGLAGGASNAEMMANGEAGAKIAFSNVFSQVGGTVLFVFVIVSCLGTLNGLMLGCTRGVYSLAARGLGPKPKVFSQIDPRTNMASNSAVFGLLMSALWLFFWYGSIVRQIGGEAPWFGVFSFDASELPIVTLYAAYIPMFLLFIKKSKSFGLSNFRRWVAPLAATLCCIFMVFAACYAHGMSVVYYLILFTVIMLAGIPFSKPRKL